jgi:hypothetical protein
MNDNKDNRTPLERLMRLGWEALDAARREPPTLDRLTQNARDAIETARKGIFDETSLKTFDFNAPLDNATTANVELEMSVGESRVYALEPDNPMLIAAHLKYLGALAFGVHGDVQRQAYLRQATQLTVGWVNPIHWATRPGWDVGLSSGVPLDLRVQAGVGDAELNLVGLQLQSLRVDGNIGAVAITLPSVGHSYPATIRGAAGAVALNVPDGAAGTVNVRGGVGGLAVTIGANAAVRVNVSGGLGRVVMEPGFNRLEAAVPVLPNTGVWETASYASATRRVEIDVADGLVGNISVRVLGR